MFGMFKGKAKKAKALDSVVNEPKKGKVSNMEDDIEPEEMGGHGNKEINHHLYTHKKCFDKAEDDFCEMMHKIKKKFDCDDDKCGRRRRRRRRGRTKNVFHLHWGAEVEIVEPKDCDCD